MKDFDITWGKPSKAQEAALGLAIKRKVKKLTEFEVAELICLSQHSLWYTQAKNWSEKPPITGDAAEVWKLACKVVADIVERGYNEESEMWWDIRDWTKEETIQNMLLLMDFGSMLKQWRQRSLSVGSAGFEFFIAIVCGNNWESKYRKFLKAATTPA